MTGDLALLRQLAGAGADIAAIARAREAVSPKAPHMPCFARRPLDPAIERDRAKIGSRPRIVWGFPGQIGVLFKLGQVSSQCGR